MKIDLHIHSSDRSLCGTADDEQMIRAAIECGLDGIAFTDHQVLVPPQRLIELNRDFAPFKVFGGIEVPVAEEHIVVLGVNDPVLETRQWTYPELHQFVKHHDGLLFISHPYRWNDEITVDLHQFPPDAVEINSSNMTLCDGQKIDHLITDLNRRPIINSDAHAAELVGIFYNELGSTPANENELLQIIKSGAYQCLRNEHRIQQLNELGYNLR